MAIETERKFLVRNQDWRLAVTKSFPCRQGYLSSNSLSSVRVRVIGDLGEINVKAMVIGMSRAEYAYTIPAYDAEQMLANLTQPGKIEKIRHYHPMGSHMWEIDEFHGQNTGLIVAEIELNDEAETFDRPDWLGEEVTGDLRYYNVALAQTPYCTWKTA